MPIPTFPSYLPKVLMTDYGIEPKSNVIKTDLKSGLSARRRRSKNSPTEVSVAWRFNMTELALFQRFFEVEAHQGTSWFYIKLVNGIGESTVVARFKESYTATTEAKEFLWKVTSVLEIMDAPTLP